MPARDNFPPKVRKVIAERAAHFCSNPHCRRLTAGPHSDPGRSLTTGHAAHIHAAAPGGPRYDPNQTTPERKSIDNAIWLCRECGDIVDKDTSPHSPSELRRWRADHEALVAEVRTKGYSASLALLQTRAAEPEVAKQLLDLLADRRVFWELFDAELPDRVRMSLDRLRGDILRLRRGLVQRSPLDQVLEALGQTVVAFFRRVEKVDLGRLRCDSRDPEWLEFVDALLALRKSVGLQLFHVATTYRLVPSQELATILPMVTSDAAG